MNHLLSWFNMIMKKRRELRRWQRVVTVLAAVITFATTYALILPAITVEREHTDEVAGMYLEQETDRDAMLEEDAIEPTDISLDTDQENTGGYADSADGENISAAPVVSILKSVGSDYTVTVTYDETSGIPEDAALYVSEIARESEEYQTYLKEAKKAMGLTEEETLPRFAARFFDIKIMADDKEFTPETGVSVEITYEEPLAENPETEVNAVHFADESAEAEIIEASTTEVQDGGSSTVEFVAESFSVYGVVYTVDFYWEVNGETFDVSMKGGDVISLRELIEVLHILDDKTEGAAESAEEADTVAKDIDRFMENIDQVTFSDESLVKVARITEDITAGDLKDQLDLAVEYAGDLSDEDIAELNQKEILAPDWAMISLRPFYTEELLTVLMKDGEEFNIRVTDGIAETVPSNMQQLTTADTRSQGVKMWLFDYDLDGTLDNQDNKANTDNNKSDGINAKSDLKFLGWGAGNENGSGTSATGINDFTGLDDSSGNNIRALQGIVLNTLSDNGEGYPVLNNGQSLAYLFDPDASTGDRVVYGGSSQEGNINKLFEYKNGYYIYDSDEHYAELNGNNFKVYTSTLAQTNKNGGEHNPTRAVGFFPFDSYAHTYYDLKYENDGSHYGNNGTLYLNPDGNNGPSGLNHHLGVAMEMDILLTEYGTVDGTADGTPAEFVFSGDDDMWVFIDGQLVLDVGGLHQPVDGKIDFKTGKATIVGKATQSGHSDNTGDNAIVTAEGAVNPRGNDFSFYPALGLEKGDGKVHTLKVFYMERGGCDSNCMISFNLPLVKTKGEVTIAKYDSSKDPAVPLKDVEFGLYSDSECKELIETLKSDASGMLKVENLNVPDGQTRYYLKETKALPGYKTDTQVYTLVPGEAVNGVSTFIVQDENGDTIGTIEIGSKSYPVIYNKKPEPISLSVKKSWLDEDGNEILDSSSYSATFNVHRLKSYTEHIVVDLPAPPTSTLKIGYYYYDGPWWAPVRQYGLYNGLSYDYVAETDATVTYDYNDSHGSHRYIIDGEENNDLLDSGTVTIRMPEAGETTTIYFYDEWRNGWALSTTVKGQESKPVHVERDEPHEYEPDPSFECESITLENGVTSGTFDSGEEEYEGTEYEGKFPVKKTIDDVLYTYTYYITEDPVEGFISSSGDHYSEEDDLTENFVNQKKPKSQPIDVDEKPDYDKTLKENMAANGKWDGTYTLSLDVTGKAISKQSSAKDKADIILVLDMSSSMRDPATEGQSRYDAEMAAVRALSESLMGLNTTEEPDNIRMSVITFGNHAEIKGANITTQQGISDVLDTIEMPPNGYGADAYNIGQGTNWEAALSAVQSIRTRNKDIADTMVIFVSDGNPTLRDTLGDYERSDVPTGYEIALHSITGAYGLGTDVKSENAVGYLALLSQEHYDKSVKRCYDAAVPLAQQIVDSGKELYTIAAFGSLDRMKNLVTDVGEDPADYYKHAEDPQALAVAFEELFDRASKAIDFRNVKICDPLTAAAKTLMSVNGTPVDFKYYKVDKNNQETPWTDAPAAVFDEDTATVDWDLSSVGALENDVTYRVSFTVWPNQDAYDAVLELNQSDKKPETVQAILSKEKYRDIAQYITKDPEGNFIVYSNGDATLKYRKAVSIDGGDPVLGPEETLYYPHPSMKTQQYTMKVAKLWNDSLYPNNRLNKVKFEIYEDNAPYSVCQEIILDSKDFPSDATRWEAEVPVSPAIRSDTIIDGVKLNRGHTYTVKEYIWVEGADEEEGQWVEGETDFHYEFDPENVTPILLNGNLGYEGDTNGDAALSGTNHVRGYVDVRKQVFDVDGTTDISDTDATEFSFKVSLKDKNGNPIKYSQYPATANTAEDDKIVKGNLTVDGHAYPIWYALFEGDDRTGLDEEDIEFGIIEDGETMRINAKQTFQLFNVPSGTWYSFAEQAISGYVIKDGTSATQSGTQVHNGSAEILFQNVKHVNKTTSVTLKKVDKDDLNATNPDLLSGAIFTITRYPSQDAPGKDTEWGDDGSKTLADEKVGDNYTLGGVFTFDDLTEGYYVIEEDKYPEGYVKLSGNPSFKVSANASGDLIITIVNDADGLVKLIDGQMAIKVGNERGAALPATGGPGTRMLYLLGGILTLGAGLLLMRRRTI